ncbi:MAG: NADPH-dependent 7-cyano-7-deazaguanine reductase QueF [Gammaproteobacteria bacterium]
MLEAAKLIPAQSDLGNKSEYNPHYNPDKLFPILRKFNRDKISIPEKLPFFGFDIWNHYEVSWLNEKGKPIVGIAEIIYGCDSLYIIESKSMKLYFNSFNNTKFRNVETLNSTIKNDLEIRIGLSVNVKVILQKDVTEEKLFSGFNGICIDELDINCSHYTINPSLLYNEETYVSETLYSNLLKSNCFVTNQPDWGSIQIDYEGKKINHPGLLRYIVSFRNCNEFSETSIEQIFMDIMQYCKPTKLTVYGRFTRRGGIDINPYRSTSHCITHDKINLRFCRQ